MLECITSDYGGLSEADYRKSVNTPSGSQLYFDTFHRPLVERVIVDINVLKKIMERGELK